MCVCVSYRMQEIFVNTKILMSIYPSMINLSENRFILDITGMFMMLINMLSTAYDYFEYFLNSTL